MRNIASSRWMHRLTVGRGRATAGRSGVRHLAAIDLCGGAGRGHSAALARRESRRQARKGGVCRWLLLGRAGRVPARQGRDQRRVRLCRRRAGALPSTISSARERPATPKRSRSPTTRRGELRQAAAGVLLGRAQSDAAQLPGARPRHAVPLGDLSDERRRRRRWRRATSRNSTGQSCSTAGS